MNKGCWVQIGEKRVAAYYDPKTRKYVALDGCQTLSRSPFESTAAENQKLLNEAFGSKAAPAKPKRAGRK